MNLHLLTIFVAFVLMAFASGTSILQQDVKERDLTGNFNFFLSELF